VRQLLKSSKVLETLLFLAAAAAVPAQQISRIDLKGALARARQYGGQIEAANIATRLAQEDRKQAVAASLPSASAFNQYIYTEGNSTPSGVFVANDGVHIYNEQLQAHEEVLALARRGEIRVARAAEAVQKARADVAARGLNAVVIQDYYTIAADEEKLANAQKSLAEAQQFQDITQKQEKGGEAAHADVIKAQLQWQQRQRDAQEAQFAVDKAKVALAVLIFPSLQENYEIVNDLAELPALTPFEEIAALSSANSADLHVAQASLTQAQLAVGVARYAYLPSLGLDVFYGLDANELAIRTDKQNLGYVAQATLNVPVWNWGAIHSRVKQAALREQQAKLDLTVTQKQLAASLANFYEEAKLAFTQIESLRSSNALAAESLRLTLLRYTAGEATALEVVDAQTTASQARNGYDDGLLRYRIAIASLQNLTGNF
jgi:outer membrane protein TolC